MKNDRRLLFFLLTLSVQTFCVAQEREPVSVNYSMSKLKYNDTSANADQLDIKLRLPLYQKNKSTFVAITGYKNVALNNFPERYTQSLHGITVQTIWLYKFSNKKSVAIFVQAGLFSDMTDVSGKDFRYSAGFRYRCRHSDQLITGWGLAYSRQFFGNQVVPFMDVDYRPNGKWSITGQFPVRPKVLYHFNKKCSAGIEVNGEAASYRLSSTKKNDQFIQINQWTGLCKLEYQFTDGWQFCFGIGRNFKQSYKLYNDASNTPWTIITIPLGGRPEPVGKIEGRGVGIQLGISLNPFGQRQGPSSSRFVSSQTSSLD